MPKEFADNLVNTTKDTKNNVCYKRLEWAVATASNSPHLWSHEYKGTPLQILIEHAKKSV
jgi:hypothetical protein